MNVMEKSPRANSGGDDGAANDDDTNDDGHNKM